MTPLNMAKKIATRMVREHRLIVLHAPDCIRVDVSKSIIEAWEKAEDLGIVDQVRVEFPQAYEEALADSIFESKIERSLFGDLISAIEGRVQLLMGNVGSDEGYPGESFGEDWITFVQNLPEDKEQACECLDALWGMLTTAKHDLQTIV